MIAKLITNTKIPRISIPTEMGEPRADQMQGTKEEQLCELAGRVCYDSLGKGRSSVDYHKHIFEVGHFSIYEHANYALRIDLINSDNYERALEDIQDIPSLSVHKCESYNDISNNMKFPVIVLFNLRHVVERKGGILAGTLNSYINRNRIVLPPIKFNDLVEQFNYSENLGSSYNLENLMSCGKMNWYSFYIEGSRGFSHELVRHGDWTAISQRSTRYVNESTTPWVRHPDLEKIIKHSSKAEEIHSAIDAVEDAARDCYNLINSESHKYFGTMGKDKFTAIKCGRGIARGFLGNNLYTSMVFTVREDELMHIQNMRDSEHAESEIRKIVRNMIQVMNPEGKSI